MRDGGLAEFARRLAMRDGGIVVSSLMRWVNDAGDNLLQHGRVGGGVAQPKRQRRR